jgi:hypothetical protein
MATIVTVLGDEVELYVETDEPLPSQVEVVYTAVEASEGGTKAALPPAFTERLTAVPSKLRDPPNTAPVASRMKWIVDLGKVDREALLTVTLEANVRGTFASGRKFFVKVSDQLKVIGIPVTKDPKLTRIMQHEFSTDAGAASKFDPGPAEAFSGLLHPRQRKLLLDRAQANPAGRMVVLVTLYDTAARPRRMRAEMFDAAVRANASFTVFHCEDPFKRGITLVCHTEHFVVNFFNPSTHEWIKTAVPGSGRKASEYMQRNTAKPVRYLLGAALPTASHDAVVYFVVCQEDGKSIMGRNYLHGIVNTHGCWMLFRNFNWPRAQADAFELIYRKDRKSQVKDVAAELAKLGYDDPGRPGVSSSSEEKWFFYDRNFAYFWFCRDVVGIDYFSPRSWIERDRFPKHPFPAGQSRAMNEFNTHGRVFEKSFPFAQASAWQSFQGGSAAYHDAGDIPKVTPTDALWKPNAMGLRTSPGFASASFPVEVPVGRTWADLYFYKEDGLDVTASSPLVARNALEVPGSRL